MHSLKPYNDTAAGLSDLLDSAALMDDGIVQGKSGALLAGWFYRGQDIASSTADERNYITRRMMGGHCSSTAENVTTSHNELTPRLPGLGVGGLPGMTLCGCRLLPIPRHRPRIFPTGFRK